MSNSEAILSDIGNDESAAISAVTTQVTSIVTSVDAATASLSGLAGSEAADVQAALTTLLTEINSLTETLVAVLGESKSRALSLEWRGRCKSAADIQKLQPQRSASSTH
jgi:hypothetical protein